MMDIDAKTIEYIAVLAHLSPGREEIEKLKPELQKILSYMRTLDEADLESVPETEPVLTNVMRPDEVVPSYDRETLLRNAPAHNNETIIVPKTVE